MKALTTADAALTLRSLSPFSGRERIDALKILITASLFLFTAFNCSQQDSQPPAGKDTTQQPTTAETMPSSIPVFDGKRAFAQLLQQTSFGPRNPNSSGHQACLEYLVSTLRALGGKVETQPFTQKGYDGELLQLTNVVAAFQPQAKSRVLLCAHWDTRPRAEQDPDKNRRNEPILGANDGASGVAVLLELASLLQQQAPRIGVDIVLFDGEDYGKEGDHAMYLLGSRHFARVKPQNYQPQFGILLDMVGDAYLDIPKEQNSVRLAPDIVELVWRSARTLQVTQFLEILGSEVMDDHLPLNDAGIKTIDLIDFDYPDPSNRYWHTTEDTPAHCSPESLEAVGSVITHVIYTQEP